MPDVNQISTVRVSEDSKMFLSFNSMGNDSRFPAENNAWQIFFRQLCTTPLYLFLFEIKARSSMNLLSKIQLNSLVLKSVVHINFNRLSMKRPVLIFTGRLAVG